MDRLAVNRGFVNAVLRSPLRQDVFMHHHRRFILTLGKTDAGNFR